jgi:AraC family transcriptional regulator, transcriptional activator of pobA
LRRQILHFDDINASHAAMGFSGRTDLPDFHIYTIEETYPSTRQMMPPYTLRFYCLVLMENSDDAVLELNAERLTELSDTISFQAPNHVSAWVRGEKQRGFILYFQPEFMNHLPTPLNKEFGFFQPAQVNMLSLTIQQKTRLKDHFLRLRQTFQNQHPYRVPMLQAFLLALLYDCKGLFEEYRAQDEIAAPKPNLTMRFQHLLEQHYLVLQTVAEYAELLSVTPNYLSQAVSNATGQRAYDLITDRLLLEAKKLLRYTDLPVAEIADFLGFEEPTHFGRFFKRKLSLTPVEYRRSVKNAA